ncbi:putative leucine-rich repeat domain superfamily, F-box-like domain superfamily [Helianthus annuus]|nr:putative leucine-rich repeat domain superfamily, F-box-like domain superfamily [Helianthus annuus]
MKSKRLSKSERLSKAKRLSLDKITALPLTIIETILCLIPIKEAARTSILSREWRYRWTSIPKLDFSDGRYGRQIMETSKLIRAIHQVLSLRHDPVHEFSLYIDDVDRFGKTGFPSRELNQIIRHLSKNHPVKKLRLYFDASGDSFYNLPSSVFSLHHLTELYLGYCRLGHQSKFNGFRGLTSLSLDYVRISRKTLLHLLSTSPSLKRFTLLMLEQDILGREKSTMIELFERLPVIEHLTILGEISPWFVPDLVPQELPTSLIHLKYFCFTQMSFHDGFGLTFLAVLIKNSPNLEKIDLEIDTDSFICEWIRYPEHYEKYHSDVWLEHLSDVWLEHLNELKIEYISNLEPEMDFLKFILARSPKLKKVSIRSEVKKDQESGMLKTLLRAPRASAVEIDVV